MIARITMLFLLTPFAIGSVVRYEGDRFPEEAGWVVFDRYCQPTEWIEAGEFCQQLVVCPGQQPPRGQRAVYERSLAEFEGTPTFFVEWRVHTDAPRSEIPWGGGARLAIGGFQGISYSFYIASDQAKLYRGSMHPIMFVDLDPAVAHTFRLELIGDEQYTWRIDGVIVDSGIPVGAFPSARNDIINWAGASRWFPNTTRWDYIRYGTIEPAKRVEIDTAEPWIRGDVNCDGLISIFDIDPFVLALIDTAEYAAQYPDCDIVTADVNTDGYVNSFDIDAFIVLLADG